jgi:hypothetical protein
MPCNSNDEWYHFDLGFLREILVNNLQKMAVAFINQGQSQRDINLFGIDSSCFILTT